jgi:hypothetical protein
LIQTSSSTPKTRAILRSLLLDDAPLLLVQPDVEGARLATLILR